MRCVKYAASAAVERDPAAGFPRPEEKRAPAGPMASAGGPAKGIAEMTR